MKRNASRRLQIVVAGLSLLASVMPLDAQQGRPEWLTIGPQDTILNNFSEGNFTAAIAVAKEDLAARERQLGPNHPDLLEKMEQLGMLYLARRNISAAETLFNRELAIAEREFGPHHSKTISALNGLLAACMMDGRFEDAAKIQRRIRPNP